MAFDRDSIKKALKDFRFEDLFIEGLGWDNARGVQLLREELEEVVFEFSPIALKRDLVVFLCEIDGEFPVHALRKKLDNRIAKSYREHFIIYVDAEKSRQLWQWVWREPGRPLVSRTHQYRSGQPGESLLQKLELIAFSLEEEDSINIVEVSGRLRAAFNVEKATKKFYDVFKKERTTFEQFISGIEKTDVKHEYVSVMLNRLMFIYFIQRKGFLDGDPNYLRNRMNQTKAEHGDDQFYSFYRYFLLRLFHEALGKVERNPALEELIGDVPYLNGGIFEIHEIEKSHPGIQIPDEAFERVLNFFDSYQWHLDDRPLREDNEINPDVLGYIFEKYINQKQMGAYYTKEDITEYISKNTIIPYLFDAAQKIYPKAFKGEESFWILLEADPRRYIYESVQKGVDLPLPEEIAKGIDDVSQRELWNTKTPDEYALPTEIWRETVARRLRFEEVKTKLESGVIRDINDLITYNLDIRQFAQDVIETCDRPETLRAFWKAIRDVTILDPTCGSGAFLFAALNILHPLYEACLAGMQIFVDDLPDGSPAHALKDFKDTLEMVEIHPNHEYFILKSIIVNNLFGVDIMPEAVEIAKLRLFLKIAAHVVPDRSKANWGIEPLPDIDFNIRCGNTLIGFTSREDVQRAFLEGKGLGGASQDKLFITTDEKEILDEITEKAADIDRLYKKFREMQIAYNLEDFSNDYAVTKKELLSRLSDLGDELDRALANQYGVNHSNQIDFDMWHRNHLPFHWYIEYFSIMQEGGFNVIIGNPPYVSKNKIQYEILSEDLSSFPDIYASITLRSLGLIDKSNRFGMILPLSITFSRDYVPLRDYLERAGNIWLSSFDNIPAAIFYGVSQRCTIVICKKSKDCSTLVAPMHRWRAEFRQYLMEKVIYTVIQNGNFKEFGFPKVPLKMQSSYSYLMSTNENRSYLNRRSIHRLGFSQSARNFISVFIEDPPCIDVETLNSLQPSMIGNIYFSKEVYKYSALAILVGELYFWYWLTRGDGFHVTTWIVSDFLNILPNIDEKYLLFLIDIGKLINSVSSEAIVFKKNAGKYVGNYNFREHYGLTRRADLILAKAIGFSKQDILGIFDYVQRSLSINIHAGEKSIPDHIKEEYQAEIGDIQFDVSILIDIDNMIRAELGFNENELNFLLSKDSVVINSNSVGSNNSTK